MTAMRFLTLLISTALLASVTMGQDDTDYFRDFTGDYLPLSVYPGVVMDSQQAEILKSLFVRDAQKGETEFYAFRSTDDMVDLIEFYERVYPVTFKAVTIDYSRLLEQYGSTNRISVDSKELTRKNAYGMAAGSLLLIQPYYDFVEQQWNPDTLMLLSR